MLSDTVNTDYNDMHSWISADEEVLLFISEGRPDVFGTDEHLHELSQRRLVTDQKSWPENHAWTLLIAQS
jgi:hypothetical protein